MKTLDNSQVRRARRLKAYGYTDRAIGAAMCVSAEDVRRALGIVLEKPSPPPRKVVDTGPPPVDRVVGTPPELFIASYEHRSTAAALAERERRQAAALRQSITAKLCGDPPPGFSALDKRQRPANLAEPPTMRAGFKVGLSE
jgi:hypothetical protein